MPGLLTKEQREAFFTEPHVVVLSVANTGGRPPHSVPVWYAYEPGGNVTFFTNSLGHVARKAALIRDAKTVSLCVQHEAVPYKYVTIEGTVIGEDNPPSADQVLAIVRRYLPEDAAQGFANGEMARQNSPFTVFTIRPDRWLSFDFGDDGGDGGA